MDQCRERVVSANGAARRVLVSTLSPTAGVGGVTTMARFVCRTLRDRGFTPVLAHYEPYKINPVLSVPSYRLLQRQPGAEQRITLDDTETHAIGAWLPELEFTQHLATDTWKRLIDSSKAHLSVSGTALASLQYHQARIPFLAWVATPWKEDRVQRVKQYPFVRKVLDRTIVGPVTQRLERSIIGSGQILSLSHHTKLALNEIAGAEVVQDVLSQPVDAEFFAPREGARVPGRIGFSGRLDDPRKNIDLLLEAFARVIKAGHRMTLMLIGGEREGRLAKRLAELGIDEQTEVYPLLPTGPLRDKLQTFDLYVVPSKQEGLCIAALEAMACGVPVVSTRCGGPEEFVIEGETGSLVGFDAREMADAIVAIVGNRSLRERIASGARDLMLARYSTARAEDVFWKAFGGSFPWAMR